MEAARPAASQCACSNTRRSRTGIPTAPGRLKPRTRAFRAPCSSAKDSAKQAAAAPPPPPAAQRPSNRLTRMLSWRSSAQPAAGEVAKTGAIATEAGDRQQPQQPPTAPQPTVQRTAEEAAAVAPRPGTFSLYSWLTWGSGSAASGASTDAEGEAAELADGMAAEPARAAAAAAASSGSGSGGSSWRRSWAGLSLSGSVASFDPEDAPAQRQQQQQQQQQHDVPVPVDHPALQLLRQRALSRSTPAARKDPFKLGLVVEGGGMRGCVSGGGLQALSDLGLRDAFDAVYGSSAGAINSTYFLSGQRTGVEIYHDHIAQPEFIDLKRLWKGEGAAPVLNLPFLIDHVMRSVHPLDWQAVLDSPVPLKVVASSLDSLSAVLLEGFADDADLAACLKASATVPEIAGGPCLHRGQCLVDAAVFEAVPFRSAIADGCTHLLVLCTRPARRRRSRVNAALADAMEVAIKKAVLSPDYMVPAWKAEVDCLAQDGLSQDEMLLAAADREDAHELPWFAGAHVYPLYPGAAANFSPLCIDPPTLRAGVAEGRRGMLAVLRAVLGDQLDFSRFEELQYSNIVPTRSASSSSARLWRRYLQEDFSHHA